jgi:type I restriction enzyme S subunit
MRNKKSASEKNEIEGTQIEEQFKELPRGWVATTIGEICVLNPRHTVNDMELNVTFVRMADIAEESPVFNSFQVKPLSAVKKGFTHFVENDVLFAKITPCMENGKAAIAKNLENGLGCGTTELHVIRPPKEVDNRLIYHFIHQHSFRAKAKQEFTGTAGQQRVPIKFISDYPFLLPPLAEQKRIADKLDSLLAKVESCKAQLERVPGVIKQFRQSVLAAAVSGKLTEDWRDKKAIGGIDKITKQVVSTFDRSKPNEEEYPVLRNQPKLPENWDLLPLFYLADDFSYGSSSKSSSEGKVPVVRMGNIQDGKLVWDDLVYTSDLLEIEKYKLTSGDVLFNRTNSPELVGKTAVFKGERIAINAGYLIRIKPSKYLLPDYLSYCINSVYGKEYCWKVKTDSVSQSNINAQKIARFKVPFCTVPEQQEIINRVEAFFTLSDNFEHKYNIAMQAVNDLTSTILSKAFRGELVPQDPNDEPAEKLLERIKKERESSQGAVRKKTKKQPPTQEVTIDFLKSEMKIETFEAFQLNNRDGKMKKEQGKPILELLKSSKDPIAAKDLWQQSIFADDIDAFYAELKKIENQIVEIKDGLTSKLRLKK